VVLAVIAIRLLLKKVPKIFSYVLWLPVLIRLVSPFSFNSSFSFFSFLRNNAQTGTGAMKQLPNSIGLIQNPAIKTGINILNNAVNTSLPSAIPIGSANPMQNAMELASIIWVIGMAILIFYSIISYLKVICNVKTATPVRDNIFETDRITSPFVNGFIRPKIFIPIGLGENELSYILAHEQTHIKRLDYLIKPFAYLVLVVHWFNPLIWISFSLMTKDMEMSCDESVITKLGNDIKGRYSNSLLSHSVKSSGLLTSSPLAFGESNIKSRIKNILAYKKPAFWVVIVTIIVTTTLIVAFATNPKNEQVPIPNTYLGYNIDALATNKTPYVGNNGKVVALIDAIPLPAGIVRDKVELQTGSQPYEITISLNMNDALGIMEQGTISGNALYRNSIMLFSLIDNVDTINYKISDNTGNYEGTVYGFTHTRGMTEELMDGDVRPYAVSTDALKKLIDRVNSLSFDTVPETDELIETNIKIIMSSPTTSSSPADYIKAHKIEYNSIILMGDEALEYLFDQFKKGNNNDLRGQIMMALCKDLLGDRNNVTDESLSPQDWFSKLSIKL
ncbi:MAG: M56 family metallopeptidase, partial [Ruminiclostridium sp.]